MQSTSSVAAVKLNGPSEHQRTNLKRMMDILSQNAKAVALAEALWTFFHYRLLCGISGSAGESQIDYNFPPEYAPVVNPGEMTPSIRLARSDRQAEALVHELLHLELLRIGYPKFWFDRGDSAKRGLARGIQNSADHEVMLPIFIGLGYAGDRFLTPRVSTADDSRILGEIKTLADLQDPKGYASSVSTYLHRQGFNFRLVYVKP